MLTISTVYKKKNRTLVQVIFLLLPHLKHVKITYLSWF